MKKPIAEIRDDLKDVSNQISTQVRTLTLGVLAVAWLGLSGSDEVKALNLSGDWQLAAIALLCIVTLGIDLAQYQFGYKLVYRTLLTAEKARQTHAAYSRNNRWYRLRLKAFAVKQFVALVAAGWLIVFIAVHLTASTLSGAPAAATHKVVAPSPTAKSPAPATQKL